MTTAEREALQAASQGIDTALTWLEADIRRLQASLDAGIQLDVIGALNPITMEARND